jgi:hypothetical protein
VLGSVLAAFGTWLLTQAIQTTATASQLFAAAQSQAAVPPVAGPEVLRWGLFLVGLSFTFIAIPVQTLALEALKGEALAKASSLFLSTKLIFSSIGVALVTTILIDQTRSRATDLVSQLQSLSQGSGVNPSDPRVAAALQSLQAQIAAQAGTGAIQSIFWLIFFLTFALIALALFLPSRASHAAEEQAETQGDLVTANS